MSESLSSNSMRTTSTGDASTRSQEPTGTPIVDHEGSSLCKVFAKISNNSINGDLSGCLWLPRKTPQLLPFVLCRFPPIH